MPTFPARPFTFGHSIQSLILKRALGGGLLLAVTTGVAVAFWPVPPTSETFAGLGFGAAFGFVATAGAVPAWIAMPAARLLASRRA